MKPQRLLAPLFIALAILVALLFAVAWLPLREAHEATSEANLRETLSRVQRLLTH